ncbi:MAG: hypothetical protein EOO89_02430 [Pedobacter sp.]|nr:MAG: hypothetical protein EOO89_02430 [Pedobacter sp.]
MRTQFLTTIIETLKNFGIDIIVFIAGLAGGMALLTKSTQLNKFQKLITVLSGGFTANYLTPVVAAWLDLSDKAIYGVAFLLGYGGLKSVEAMYLHMHGRLSKDNITDL